MSLRAVCGPGPGSVWGISDWKFVSWLSGETNFTSREIWKQMVLFLVLFWSQYRWLLKEGCFVKPWLSSSEHCSPKSSIRPSICLSVRRTWISSFRPNLATVGHRRVCHGQVTNLTPTLEFVKSDFFVPPGLMAAGDHSCLQLKPLTRPILVLLIYSPSSSQLSWLADSGFSHILIDLAHLIQVCKKRQSMLTKTVRIWVSMTSCWLKQDFLIWL